MLPAFLEHAARHGLLPPGSRVIAALSGGADSTCLLHLLLAARGRLGIEVEVAHFNHRLRGLAADRDAAAAARAAAALGLRFHLGLGRPFSPAARRRASVQELAREQRLGFLLRLARRRRGRVALGHTADDQAETLLMRFLAGSGPAGLGGIPPASHGELLVHPLLFARRGEVEAWLASRGLPWRTDRSNRSPRYFRNRVRKELLPLLAREYSPGIVPHLNRLARALRLDNEALETQAAALLARAETSPGLVRFRPGLLEAAPAAVAARALLAALRALAARSADFSSRHLEALLAPGGGARSFDLPGGVTGRRDGAGLALAACGGAPRPPPLPAGPLPVPGRAPLPGGAAVTARAAARPAGFDPRRHGAAPSRVALDRACVDGPLVVRGRRPGDRFQPLGMAAGKLLKEFLIDAKVPAGARPGLPLVCDAAGIVWVAGVRPAERCRVRPGTRRLLLLELVGPAAAKFRA